MTATVSFAFHEHQAWLERLHSLHAAHVAGQVGHLSPLPVAPMTWGHFDDVNDMPSGASRASVEDHFAGIALGDDDFDAPVYRSLGQVQFAAPLAEAPAPADAD